MLTRPLCLLLLVFPFSFLQAQYLIAYERSDTYSEEELRETWKENKVPEFISPVNYGVEVYDIDYWTTWHDGTRIKASGLYWVPVEIREDLPLAVFHHGSRSKRSRKVRLGGEQVIAVALATDGYAAITPDYVGLGRGEKHHLYHHSETEANSALDMIRAVRELNDSIGVGLRDQLFISGYSQGGHAAMATAKMIEEKYPEEFPLTASAPLSGAYDLGGVQTSKMFDPYAASGYLPFLLWGFNEVYEFYPSMHDVLKPEYADQVMYMMESGKYTLGAISDSIPEVPAEVVKDEIVRAYLTDPDFPFRQALEENSLIDWKPQRPMQICYCKPDEQVDYRNALVARERMKELGSKSVKVKHAGRFDHRTCALYASVYTKMYFDSFSKKGSTKGRKGPVFKRMLISIAKIGTPKSKLVEPETDPMERYLGEEETSAGR